ncbi:zinc finger and SCAN domain-containing protein 22-like [Ictalurus furcatus]|uniref:zinc finger and SCAN domain-containing protein 22-like n=1 Tax=Ictalurus furcatus TaxID=66913 RepID=UPI00234FE687|nr:zinc finger and SCAN domain-containing protein 22-like [Ictalurus furcatus]XP_053485802.1 zinc finger and SCAN domain-containing protein 22-like [Ictalurus furcatus]
MDTLLRLTKRWLQPDMHSASEVVERVAVDQFLRTLPPTEHQAVGMRAPRELLTALEHTLTTLALGKEGQHQQGHPDYGAPRDEPSPTEPDHVTLKKTQKTWPAGRVLPTLDRPKPPQRAKGSTSATGLPGPRRGGRRDRR